MCAVPAVALLSALVCVLQMKCQYGNMKKESTHGGCKKGEEEPLLGEQEAGSIEYS
jgi:hypothetical protein